jgi:uncharacterized protein YbjQ (UPF0145 family)
MAGDLYDGSCPECGTLVKLDTLSYHYTVMHRGIPSPIIGDATIEIPKEVEVLPAAEPGAAVLLVTSNEIPGHHITQVHGDVFGTTVRARNYFSNLGASVRTIVGGEASGYTRLVIDTRNEARRRLQRAALEVGANAVIAMRFDCNEIGDIMSEVTAYGTAVTARALDAPGQPTA